MKSFHHATKAAEPTDETAQLAIETGVRVVRLVRRTLRTARTPDSLSLSALRTLGFLVDNPAVCLSDLAEHLFVGVPTASKLVDELVQRGLLSRTADPLDRRRLALDVTNEGRHVVDQAAGPAQVEVAALLARLDAKERAKVRDGLLLLHRLLAPTEREPSNA